MTETLFVSGGGGFLGLALIKALKVKGFRIKTINRGRYPELETLDVEVLRGDLADYETARQALQGCNAVFHVAAKPGVWGPYQDYYDSNVKATANVVRACRELGIKKLIFTSSPSVTFAGVDQENVDESVPYPKTFFGAYSETKALAEQLVMAANDQNLATVSLRPHLIWGPGDRHLHPRIIARAQQGRLRFIGPAGNRVDAVYIDNAVDAHIKAYDRLEIGSAISGRAYFIGNNEPLPLEDIINRILAAADLPPQTKRISVKAALRIARIMEWAYSTLRLKSEPPLTRFVVLQLSTSHWFNPSSALRDLDYQPSVSMDEGFRRLRAYLKP